MAKKKILKETKKAEEVKKLCPECKYFIENKCEHKSNIKYILEKRIEKKAYISLVQKTECEFCSPKD